MTVNYSNVFRMNYKNLKDPFQSHFNVYENNLLQMSNILFKLVYPPKSKKTTTSEMDLDTIRSLPH